MRKVAVLLLIVCIILCTGCSGHSQADFDGIIEKAMKYNNGMVKTVDYYSDYSKFERKKQII